MGPLEPIILALETSCDETSAAVVAGGVKVLSNVVSSQVQDHVKFGGVVPEVASRRHLEALCGVVDEALARAGTAFGDIDAVAVTYGPGLVGALLVGVSAAKAYAFGLGVPLIGVNHIEGHIYANFLVYPDIGFPLLCLVVSGGHTDLVLMEGHGRFEVVGRTRDDAAGEAFDKAARAMGLGYPGGPAVERLAARGKGGACALPRAYLEEDSYDFSFSGLKTALLQQLRRLWPSGGQALPSGGPAPGGGTAALADLAAAFQEAVVDVLADKTAAAARRYGVQNVLLAGGVAANRALRQKMEEKLAAEGRRLFVPPPELCTDNAAMVACAAHYRYLRGEMAPLTLNAVPDLKLGEERYEGNFRRPFIARM